MLLSKCTVCDSKESKFINQKKANGLLSSLGIKAPLSKLPLVGTFVLVVNTRYIINEIANRF